MSDDTIRIPIETPANISGAERAIRALERLARAQGQQQKATTSAGAAADRLSRQGAQVAAQQAREAAAAAKVAEAQSRVAKSAAQAALAEQKLQTEAARTAAAQDRAASAALRRAQAEQRAARQGQNKGLGPALPRTVESFGPGAIGQVAGLAGGALAGFGAAQLAGAAVEAAKFGARIVEVNRAFAELAAQGGSTSTALLAALRAASGNEIDDLTLKLAASKAAMLGVGDSAAEIAPLLVIARDRAKRLGIDAGQAFSDLVEGIGKAEPEILDNLGLTINLTQVYDAFAKQAGKTAQSLTTAEKSAALMNEVLRQGGDIAPPPTDEYAALGAAMQNAGQRTSELLANLLRFPAKVATEVVITVTNAAGGGNADANQAAAIAAQRAAVVQQAIVQLEQAAAGLNGALDLPAASAADLMKRLEELSQSGVPAIKSTAEALAAVYLESGDVEALATALAQLTMESERQANAAGLAAQREGERMDGVRATTSAVDESAVALNTSAAAALLAEEHTRLLAEAQDRIQESARQAANGMLGAGDQAAILASMYGLARDEAEGLIDAQRRLENAKALQDQRKGEQLGGATPAQVSAVVTSFAARQAAARAAGGRGGGRAGGGGTSVAEREAKKAEQEAERAADQAADIEQRRSDRQRDLLEKRVAAAQERDAKLADIERDSATELASIASDAAARSAEIEAQSSAQLADIRKQRAANLKAIDERAAAEQAQAARDLASTIAGTQAGLRATNAADNLALAGAGDDPALKAREAAQAAREQATQAAAQRAQGFGDATVGQAAFQAELQAIEAKQALDEEYAKRQEELAGNPQALAELEAYYQQAIDAQRAAVEQQIADAQQAADLRVQAREQEKQAVVAAAEEERKAVVAERRKAQEQVAAEAEKQRAAVATKAAEQRQAVESEFQAQNDAITKWADDTERELQRVIDKADEAVRALLLLGNTTPKGASTQLPPGVSVGTRATGGPVAAGSPYIVGEKRAELFVPETNGYVLPYVPQGAAGGGGAGATLNLTFGPGSIVQQPGEDGALLARRVAAMAYEQLRSRMQGRGF